MEYAMIILWAAVIINILITAGCHFKCSEKFNYFEKNIPLEYMKYINKEIGFCDDRRDILEDHLLKRIKGLTDSIRLLKVMNVDLKVWIDIQSARIEMLEKKSNLAARVKIWRRVNRLSLKDAESITGISQSQLSSIERGMRPSKDEEKALFKAIG